VHVPRARNDRKFSEVGRLPSARASRSPSNLGSLDVLVET
jgi:hypothetical protein